ncbi:MAG: prolyl oligopeptidase family serine peptidase [Desulfobacterota bacterium]|nr:prolyl oligopeptidase family serine peptidase [Thermodesulfobacteriota bacterium]
MKLLKIKHKHTFFNNNEFKLEGVLSYSEDLVCLSSGVVICHPHPLYGGNMNNNVVLGIKGVLEKEGFVIFRFNFRGVNFSEGKYDEGRGEVDDTITAINYLTSKINSINRLFLVGYSFGAWVSLSTAVKFNGLTAVALIAPPLEFYDFHSIFSKINLPVLIIAGDLDSISNINKIKSQNIPMVRKKILFGADHFFSGWEEEIGKEVNNFFKEYL